MLALLTTATCTCALETCESKMHGFWNKLCLCSKADHGVVWTTGSTCQTAVVYVQQCTAVTELSMPAGLRVH